MVRSPGIFETLKTVQNSNVQIYMPIAEHSFHAGSIWNYLKTQQKIEEKTAETLAKQSYMTFINLIATNHLAEKDRDIQTKILENPDPKSGKLLAFLKTFPERKEEVMKKLLEIGKFDVYVDLLKGDAEVFPQKFFDFLVNLRELSLTVNKSKSDLEKDRSALAPDKNELSDNKEEKISQESLKAPSKVTQKPSHL